MQANKNKINQATRVKIFDIFTLAKISWAGRLTDAELLGRLYDLKQMPSTDVRYADAYGDIYQHTANNHDWDTVWPLRDDRFNLIEVSDSEFLKFLVETLEPAVRDEEESEKLAKIYNERLKESGYMLLTEQDSEGFLHYVATEAIPGDPIQKDRGIIISTKPLGELETEYPGYNFILLKKGFWDDFGYKTEFEISYVPFGEKAVDLGVIKILDLEKHSTEIQKDYSKLPNNYHSLGQNIDYYQLLWERGRNEYLPLLTALNDIVINRPLSDNLRRSPGLRNSLLREAAANKAFEEAGKYLELNYKKFENTLNFTFTTHLTGAEQSHVLPFNFQKSKLPHRINVLVGKNGTGKTQTLAKLANALSGSFSDKQEYGKFLPVAPTFSKVVAISYSVFDNFERPESRYFDSKKISYTYCGILNSRNVIMSPNELRSRFEESLKRITALKRENKWMTIISSIIELNNDLTDSSSINFSDLSSGQSIVLMVMTEAIAHIENESLLLVDEPEIHLHPNALAAYINALHKMLEEFDSYAIVSTHSPILLQEIPAQYVLLLKRDGNTPIVKHLDIECFGENLSAITKEVFDTTEIGQSFKEVLSNLINDLTYEQVVDMFEQRLSLNAKIFLQSLYNAKSSTSSNR